MLTGDVVAQRGSAASLSSGDGLEMTQRGGFIHSLLEADRTWLLEQPGLRGGDWDVACTKLETTMTNWITEFGTDFIAEPEEFQLAVNGGSTATAESADVNSLTVLADREERVSRLWSVWKHHWQDSIKFHRRPTDGVEEVARRIHRGEGFRRRDSGSAGEFGNLGGNPMRDTLLVRELVRGNDRAIVIFMEEYRAAAESIYRERRRSSPPDGWWETTVADYVTQREGDPPKPPRIGGYKGESGLLFFLTTMLVHDVPRLPLNEQPIEEQLGRLGNAERWNALKEVLDTQFIEGRFEEVENALRHRANGSNHQPTVTYFLSRCRELLTDIEFQAWNRHLTELRDRWKHETVLLHNRESPATASRRLECHNALLALLVVGLRKGELTGEELDVLYRSVVQNQSGKEISEEAGIHAGNVSRRQSKAIEKLGNYVHKRGLPGMLGRVLIRVWKPAA